jgi:hypothetical protein
VRRRFVQSDGLPFADVLSAEEIERSLQEEGVSFRDAVLNPFVTLWAFLSQVLDPDGSCRAAVARLIAWLSARGQKACSPDTSPYCKARQRLPEAALRGLARQAGRRLHEAGEASWRWKGRRVKMADGSTISMPDTPANQALYPQSRSQKPGVGFPLARLVVVFCLACGSVLDAALGRYKGKQTGENALLRGLEGCFEKGDVFLADRYYCGYCDLALMLQRGVDVVVRKHHKRKSDFRTGERLGKEDHRIVWHKPKQRPDWMSAEEYAELPEELKLREVRVRVECAGVRTQVFEVITSFTDPAQVSKQELAQLYQARWHAELDLRCLKAALGMDVLRCLSPEMVHREFWTYLLAYNLIRTVMAQAAKEHGLLPRQISFTATVQALMALGPWLETLSCQEYRGGAEVLWEFIANYQVMDRPGRHEPRKVKRRAKPHPLLNIPRDQARKQLLKKG